MPPADRIRGRAGFTLLEILCVCAVIGILLAVTAPAIGFQIIQARVAAETAALQNIAVAVQATFESSDLEGTNVAALPGGIPDGVDSTAFSPSLDPSWMPATTRTFDWFAKVARQTGFAPQVGVAPTPSLQPQVAAILLNSCRSARIMMVGPADEANAQRFLVFSVVAPPGQLPVPPLPNPANPQDPANLALFNDIWNTNWSGASAVLPATWAAALSPAQIQAWQGSGSSGSRLWQMCVQRIVCPKFTITVNNTHPTDNCYVYTNFNGTTAGSALTVGANTGTFIIPGICSGRLVQAYRGPSPPPSAPLFSQFNLRDNCEITLQD